ncbi:MAG: transglycosylase SLT domain-containing protein [bacterium]
MKKVILAIWLVIASTATASAQQPNAIKRAGNEQVFRVIPRFETSTRSTPLAAARTAIDDGNWDAAWKLVASTTPADTSEVFLKGYLALQAGRPEAQALLAKASLDDSFVLQRYAARYAAQAALLAKEYQAALGFAGKVGNGLPISDDAQWIAISALKELKKTDEAAAALAIWLEKHPRDSRATQARVDLATLVIASNPALAAKTAYKVLEDDPLDANAAAARQLVEKAAKKLPAKEAAAFALNSDALKFARWRAMYRTHQSDAVVDELGKVAAKLPQKYWCEGHFLVAHSLTKLRKHANSVPWYEKIVAKCDTGDWRLRALYLGGKGRWNAGQRDGARQWFEKLWTLYPTHSYADDAMYFSARILEEDGNTKAAAQAVQKQLATYPDGDMAADAFWLEVRRLFESKKYADVVRLIDGATTPAEPDLYSRGRLAYFRARALELSDHKAPAQQAYKKVIDDYPMSYYGLLAFQRLDTGGGDAVCPGQTWCSVTTTPFADITPLSTDPAYNRAALLLDMGLASLARAEILALENKNAAHPDTLWFLADQLDKAGAHTLAHDIARRKIQGWDHAYPDAKMRRNWEIAFPHPFDADVRAYAKQRKIPAELIWAIMREESGFNPRVESWANARGLLQLMDSTGKNMAKLDGITIQSDDLFHAKTNIRLGSRYLQDLGESVAFHPVLMIAGYNGGMGNVGRWLKDTTTNDLDLFVEDIPFGQTRNYTKRVLLSYWVYAWLYGSSTVPRFAMTLPA